MDIIIRALHRSARSDAAVRPVAVRFQSKEYLYDQLLLGAAKLHERVSAVAPKLSSDTYGPRIACLADPGPGFVMSQWSAWMNNGIFVPLATSHPVPELEYTITDAEVSMLLVQRSHLHKVESITRAKGIPLCVLEDTVPDDELPADISQLDIEKYAAAPDGYLDEGSVIIYTSGTTGKPKGALHTHRSVAAQMDALSTAWQYSASDVLLHALPLHHIHGLVNALMCSHYNGGCVDFASFNARSIWRRLQRGEVTVFMGVPTMYAHLLSIYEKLPEEERARCRDAAAGLRLTVSGSAACPLPIMRGWQALSGVTLLERYGMTEVGMALSNLYGGPRVPGAVGLPLPGVEADIVMAAPGEGGEVELRRGPESGELRIRGPTLFKEYWRRPDATAQAFDEDGFFMTGDTADRIAVEGHDEPFYRILGRTSVDIIKSGGYKISALKIENHLLEHPALREVVVIGIPDDVYGERIAAIATLADGASMNSVQLMNWASDKLPPYEIPRALVVLDEIPRNAMGKVNKKALRQLYVEREQAKQAAS